MGFQGPFVAGGPLKGPPEKRGGRVLSPLGLTLGPPCAAALWGGTSAFIRRCAASEKLASPSLRGELYEAPIRGIVPDRTSGPAKSESSWQRKLDTNSMEGNIADDSSSGGVRIVVRIGVHLVVSLIQPLGEIGETWQPARPAG